LLKTFFNHSVLNSDTSVVGFPVAISQPINTILPLTVPPDLKPPIVKYISASFNPGYNFLNRSTAFSIPGILVFTANVFGLTEFQNFGYLPINSTQTESVYWRASMNAF